MNRRMLFIAFAVGTIAMPLVYSLKGMCADPTQPRQELDLIVVEPAPATADLYLELIKEKIDLLTAEELAREAEVLRKEVKELQAARKLREAEQNLQRLIDQFQGSVAAQRARVMLDAGRQHENPLQRQKMAPIFNTSDPFDPGQEFEVPPRKR